MASDSVLSLVFYILIHQGRWNGVHSRGTVELYTSTHEQSLLLHTERNVTRALQKYISLEEERLSRLERRSIQLTRHFNGFRTLLHELYSGFTSKISSHNWDDFIVAVSDNIFPKDTDLEGAATGLCRLQKTYHLNSSALIEMRSPFLPPPTAEEMAEIAYMCMARDYKTPVEWVQGAVDVAKDSLRATHAFNDVMALSFFRRKQVSSAVTFAKQVIRRPPESVNVPAILQQWRENPGRTDDAPETSSPMETNVRFYGDLCLEGDGAKSQLSGRLACRMTTGGRNPTVLLQPVKTELLSSDPIVLLFHDLFSRKECELVRNSATKKMKRGAIPKLPHFRTGKLHWIHDGDDATATRISRRISAVTGLSIKHAEPLQTVNYGLGGHYFPHHDYIMKPDRFTVETGYRLATAVIYLSDVAGGGATVFPVLNIVVRPKAGTVLFWFNMRPPRENDTDYAQFWSEVRTRDSRTLHGACPVLRGSKWIATKWFREREQGIVNYKLLLHE
ncbi:prolyl 4-hydroxylase subunit alpha-1-like [Ornithodoros turicata]|uniref:prolyl 4-hydroxylase subunit alpha-1-like n=1 Tax=Ornithodoros turicata TaxID=34597 RepID=UPI003139BDD5